MTKRMKQQAPAGPDRGSEPVRLVALSDGLFATVLTLLVLDLRLPGTPAGGSTDPAGFIRSVAPHLFSYLLTFFVAGIYWLAHHRDFDYVAGYDRNLLAYNLLFLLFVGLFPFTTAAVSLGDFKSTQYPFYWAIYSINIVLAGIMLTLTWLYASAHGLLDPQITLAQRRHVMARQLVTPAAFLISIGTQYLFPRALVGPYTLVLIPVLQWLVDRTLASADPRSPVADAAWTERLWRAAPTLIWLLIIAFAVWAYSL